MSDQQTRIFNATNLENLNLENVDIEHNKSIKKMNNDIQINKETNREINKGTNEEININYDEFLDYEEKKLISLTLASSIEVSEILESKEKSLNIYTKNSIWDMYNGTFLSGRCYCCNKCIFRNDNSWHCLPVISSNKGWKFLEHGNFRICCKLCSIRMGDQNIYAYILEKRLQGPGSKNALEYMKNNPSQLRDRCTTPKSPKIYPR